MSTDPSGLGNETCIESIEKKYINKVFTKEDWCSYKGECKSNDLLIGREYVCLLCEWRRYLNIPELLEKKD